MEIKNSCSCAQREVKVNAPGFASQSPIDPMIFRRDRDVFVVNGGNPIGGGGRALDSHTGGTTRRASLPLDRFLHADESSVIWCI